MCNTHVVLALLVLYVGIAHAWDIAISVGDRLEFYANGTKTDTVHFKSRNLKAVTYDEVHNTMLFVDKQNDNDTICGYNLGSKDTRCFIKRTGSNIQDIAFDPATELLFFTDTKEGSINSISLKDQKSEDNNNYGNLLINVYSPPVKNIVVDSCRGYIYWTNAQKNSGTNIMERARFDGSDRSVVYTWLQIYSFTIDQKTHECYFINGVESLKYSSYKKADYREKNDLLKSTPLCSNDDSKLYFSAPKALTVTNYYVYWINKERNQTTVWQRRKNADYYEVPRHVISFNRERPVGIAANYRIREQVDGLQDCEALSRLIPTMVSTDKSLNVEQTTEAQQTLEPEQTTEVKLICVHGIKCNVTSACKCTPGYIGERCDVPACENYCLEGNCTFSDQGIPTCRCNGGYSGKRCEVNACHGYCLHDGGCSLNEKSEPVCQCEGHYEGDRCEVSGCLNYCVQGSCSFTNEGHPVCRCNAGYFGERCEVNACHGYCLNHGECTLNEEDEPVCECVSNYEGSRCETVKPETLTNSLQYSSTRQKLTLTDLLSNWQKLTANISITAEVKSN